MDTRILEAGRRALQIESRAVEDLAHRLNAGFVAVVHLLDALRQSSRHLIVTGIGKSGLVGNKIAATFSSIGLPSVFLHAAEAGHGDIGLIKDEDTLLAISNSGETTELINLLPAINRRKCTLVTMTGNPESTLGRRADHVLDTGVREEACSLNLVPTASSTAAVALGDALAMALLEKRGFREEDFARYHPGGSLGRKLLTTVEDIMHTGDSVPSVKKDTVFHEVLREMSRKRLGCTLVVDAGDKIHGLITDGDIRRLLEAGAQHIDAVAGDFLSLRPKTIQKECMATKALQMMEEFKITGLIVSPDGKIIDGFIHLHDLLQAGIA
ncbi:MAG: SIS domain-containing protein [Nitrospinaceae bacterium]